MQPRYQGLSSEETYGRADEVVLHALFVLQNITKLNFISIKIVFSILGTFLSFLVCIGFLGSVTGFVGIRILGFDNCWALNWAIKAKEIRFW